jgi:hypothetical protein
VWAAGQNGWRREVGRGVWGNSGREEWARVSKTAIPRLPIAWLIRPPLSSLS